MDSPINVQVWEKIAEESRSYTTLYLVNPGRVDYARITRVRRGNLRVNQHLEVGRR